jgi:hypothetical protein
MHFVDGNVSAFMVLGEANQPYRIELFNNRVIA